jgi:hypothetical protein
MDMLWFGLPVLVMCVALKVHIVRTYKSQPISPAALIALIIANLALLAWAIRNLSRL